MKDNVIAIINDYTFSWHPPTPTPQGPNVLHAHESV